MSNQDTSKQVWLITGDGRGLSVDTAEAALTAGHDVIGTGRNPDARIDAAYRTKYQDSLA